MAMGQRRSGILLHVSSLPSRFGIGDFGPEAHRFIDFLKAARQSVWQVLPLSITDPRRGNSPYSSPSAFAGNPLFISPEVLAAEGWLTLREISDPPAFPAEKVLFGEVIRYKYRLLDAACGSFAARPRPPRDYDRFLDDTRLWLPDYALFTVLRQKLRRPWTDWPASLRTRAPRALAAARADLAEEIERLRFFQYLFHRQWETLRAHAREAGIAIAGDIPIYVDHDGADVWAHPSLFKLHKSGTMKFVSGVPPDSFSRTGQRWGNPVYDWPRCRRSGFAWWRARLRRALELFDLVRIDHFRGLASCWEIKAGERTAVRGRWVPGPGAALFRGSGVPRILRRIWAEDLGHITPDVRRLLRELKLPGMRVLLFAFGDDSEKNTHLPRNYVGNCVAYTGNHDTNTARGWYRTEADAAARARVRAHCGPGVTARNVHEKLAALTLGSRADTVILPLQDVLGLDERARMNTPGTGTGNWGWRTTRRCFSDSLSLRLAEMTIRAGRGATKKKSYG
ncbi:MAG: 4-alpha-glucanotransferase [Spirochaetales bacterium]|nr:4-alpha-glucanotransferase [Spirochaetales bacterium]